MKFSRKKKNIKALALVGILSGLMAFTGSMNVYAGSGGTDGSGTTGSGGLGGGLNTQGPTSNKYLGCTQVIEFGFLPTEHIGVQGFKGNLKENGTEEDLARSKKFTLEAGNYALYMPLTEDTKADFKGIMDFDGSGYYLRRGEDRIGIARAGSSTIQTSTRFEDTIVDIPSVAATSSNKCLQVMGNLLLPAAQHSAGVQQVQYGDTMETKFKSMTPEERTEFFEDYCKLLKNAGATDGQIDGLKRDFNAGKLTFVAQTLQRVYMGSSKSNGNYMSTHALSRAFGTARGIGDASSRLREYKTFHARKGCTSSCADDTCAAYYHPGYGTATFTREGYVQTNQAKSDIVPLQIFGGWGYFHWEGVPNREATPELTVTVKIKLPDGGEIIKETEIKDVPIKDIIDPSKGLGYETKLKGLFLTGAKFTHEGKKYEIKNPASKTEWTDKKDKEGLYGSYAQVGGKTDKGNVDVGIVDNNVYVNVFEAINPSDLKELNYYLGASSDETTAGEDANADFGANEGIPANVVDKYKDAPAESTGEKAHSDAELVIELEAEELVTKTEIDDEFIVPQWRLSRYWEDVAGHIQDNNWGEIPKLDTYLIGDKGPCLVVDSVGKNGLGTPHVPGDVLEGGANHSVPEGEVDVDYEFDDSLIENWLEFDDYVRKPEGTKGRQNEVKQIKATIEHGVVTKLDETIGTGDMLAIRTTADIDNMYTANWMGKGTVDKVENKDKGDTNYKYQNELRKEVTLKFKLKNTVDYVHNVPHYNHIDVVVGVDDEGNPITEDVCKCYVEQVIPEVELSETELVYGVKYLRHHPEDIATNAYEGGEGLEEGRKWYLKQTPALKIYPEVAMVSSDMSGANTPRIAVGDKERTVTPLAYHEVSISQKTDGKAVGTSIATDKKAGTLMKKVANGMSYDAGGTQVTHKGSPLNLSYAIDGEVTAQTWAIDIGNKSLKSAWNPGLSYDTQKVHEDFVKGYSPVKVKYTPTLYVGNTAQKGNPKTEELKSGGVNMTEYKLIVRSGKLRFVGDGEIVADNVEALSSVIGTEGVRALKKMKLVGEKSVLDVFEYGTGDVINEEEVAGLMNEIREITGGNERWVIPENGNWYHEDTTVLVLRHYKESFPLPKEYTYSDKLKMVYPNLETPIDKNKFYEKGLQGHMHLNMEMLVTGVKSDYDSKTGENSLVGHPQMKFVVPEVSVLDTTR